MKREYMPTVQEFADKLRTGGEVDVADLFLQVHPNPDFRITEEHGLKTAEIIRFAKGKKPNPARKKMTLPQYLDGINIITIDSWKHYVK